MKTKTRAVISMQGVLLVAAWSLISTTSLWAMTTEDASSGPSIATLQSGYGKLPLSFEANHGQWDAAVQFVTRGRGHQLFLTASEAVLALRTDSAQTNGRGDHGARPKPLSNPSPSSHSVVRMQFAGADPQAEMVGLEPLPGIVNYFIGNDPTKWRTNIPTYQKVGYKDLYPGIDLVYYGNQGHLEYDLVVAPGADPTQIRLAFDGAEQIAVDEEGDLLLTLAPSSTETAERAATLRLHKPVVYQMDEQGEKHLLAGTYVLNATTAHQAVALTGQETPPVSFQVASYDTSQPLIIDPVLSWATYLGGSGEDRGAAIAVDKAGSVYVTGSTFSNFPGTAGNPNQSTYGGGTADAFVMKLNTAGTALAYATYLGSTGAEQGLGIAVDAAGNAYVTGDTSSPNFPGTAGSAIQSRSGGGFDAYVTKLNAAGTGIVYSTYLGGSGSDAGNGIAVDATGNVYVTGGTTTPGSGFPGAAGSSIQSTFGGIDDAFVAKLNAAGTALLYSTYLGGRGGDGGRGIAVDTAGQAHVTGVTESSDFPSATASPIQNTFGGGRNDAFVAKLNAAGTALIYSTYLGSSLGEEGAGIAVDAAGHAYVTGVTSSSNFPGTAGSAIQSTLGGIGDAFVTKLNSAGTALIYSTYLGGHGSDAGNGIAVDAAGQAYVTGFTTSSNFPGTAGSAIQSTLGSSGDAFVAKLNSAGTALAYATYLGGTGVEQGLGIAVDAADNAYVTGNTQSRNFPGTSGSAIQSTFGGGVNDGFIAKITNTSPVNDLVTLVPLAATYGTTADPTGCPSGFVGKFGFDAQLTNENGSPPLSDLAVKVTALSNGNLLYNADGGNGGVGSMLTVPKTNGYADGTLSPGESVVVHFSICLKVKKPFTFVVDVLGMH